MTDGTNVDSNGNLVATGSISVVDPDHDQSSFQTTVTAADGDLGSLTLNADGTYTYTVSNAATEYLQQGESKTDSFTVTSLDGTTKLVSFTIVGTNEAATIGDPTVASVTDGTGVDSNGNLVATGSISVVDPDHDQSSFQTTVTAADGDLGSLTLNPDGTYTYTVANSAVEYLQQGESKTDSFTVTSLDGTTKLVSFTIVGTNEAATIGDPTVASVTDGTNVDSNGNLVATGSISVVDPDHDQSSFQTTVTAADGDLGSLILNADGTYVYTVSNAATEYLQQGESKIDTFTITSLDGTTKDITFTINGATPVSGASAPVVDLNGDAAGVDTTVSMAPDNLYHDVFPTVVITDPDSTTLESATVTSSVLGGGIEFGGLGFDTHNITITYSDGEYLLTGHDTIADYEDVLSHLTFRSLNPQDATFTVTVNDGTTDSVGATSTVEVAVPSGWEVWTGTAGDGDWNDDGNWSLSRAPISTDYVYIDAGTTVTDNLSTYGSDQSVVQLHVLTGTTLDIFSCSGDDTHSFDITGAPNGDAQFSFALENAGLIEVENAILNISGDVSNSGTIQADGTGAIVTFGAVDVDQGGYQGAGTIAAYNGTQVNYNGTFVDGGTLSVDGGSTMDFESPSPDSAGVVTLDGVAVTGADANESSASTILIGDTTSVTVTIEDGTTITDGTLIVEDGTLDVEAGPRNGLGATLDGVTVENDGTVQVDGAELPAVTLTLVDGASITGGDLTIGSVGVLDIEGPYGPGSVGNPDAILDGVTVTVDDNGAINVGLTASGAVLALEDDTTISGGTLTIGGVYGPYSLVDIEAGNNGGDSDVTLDGVSVVINSGKIDVDLNGSGEVLTLADDTTITGGTLQISASGEVYIQDGATLDDVNVINGNEIELGALAASGSTLVLEDGATIGGGTLSIGSNDTVEILYGSNDTGATLDGVSVENLGVIQVGSVVVGEDPTLTLDGGTTISGGTLTIEIGNALDIRTGPTGQSHPDATLDGVTVINDGNIEVLTASGSVLALDGGTTISGGTLTIDLGGAVDVRTGPTGQSHPDATLDGVSVANHGNIEILTASGSVLTLDDGTTITGGTLTIDGGGTVEIVYGSNNIGATFDGVSIDDLGAIQVGGAAVVGDPTLTLDDGTTISGNRTGTLTIGQTGVLDVEFGPNGGNGSVDATLDDVIVTNNGAITINANTGDPEFGAILALDDGTTVTGGTLTIGNGSTLTLNDAVVTDTAITFIGTGDTLSLDSSSAINGTSTVSGFVTGETIDFSDIDFTTESPSLSYDSSTGILTLNYLNGSGQAESETIKLAGTYDLSNFKLSDDGHGGTAITYGDESVTPQYADWQYQIDPLRASQGSSTEWIVPNSDGLTSTVFTGTGFTYDPITHLPTGGTITSMSLVDNLDHTVMQTVTGETTSLADLGGFVSELETIRSGITWSSVLNYDSNGPISFSATDIRLANTDGTFTDLIGSGFSPGSNGTVTSVEQIASDGTTVLHTVNLAPGTSLSQVADAIFDRNISQDFYDLAAQGDTSVTGYQGQVAGTNVQYTLLDDTPGNHTFTGQSPDGFGAVTLVGFGEATSGVTVNLVAGTASWGGYNDTLTNIDGVIGSRFADTIIGSNTTNYLDGGGAPTGSHDTLTGGGGSQTFVFGKGYGALTITDFDQGNGAFNHSEGDVIQLNGFSGQPTVTYVNGNTIADFGNGDVLTLVNVNPANLDDSDFIIGGNNGGPILNSFALNLAEGGTTVLTPADFNVTNPAGTDFYTVQNVVGGQFQVLTDGNWVEAQTGGFTDTQIAAGDVRFVPDGSDAAPTFTMWVSDGNGHVSPAIEPTVNFTFTDSAGHLIINDPSSFDGIISGFSGDGTLAGSDQIDLRGIDYNSTSFTEHFDTATDILTVSDGSHSATLHFSGTYQEESFKFQSDDDHGTIVYDPPVPSTPASDSITANIPVGPPAAGGGNNFSFNFTNAGHALASEFHSVMDQSGSQLLPSVQSLLSAAFNGVHADSLAPHDGPDTITPASVIKTLLHASDFHVT